MTIFGGGGAHFNPFAVLVTGGMCGIVSWSVTCEFSHLWQASSLTDNRFQRVSSAIPGSSCGSPVLQEQLGFQVSMARSCAVNAVFFSSFEFIKEGLPPEMASNGDGLEWR
jgi:hypothetical protein